MSEEIKAQIEAILGKDKVVLFMKGNPSFPQCGFSDRAVAMLKNLDIEFAYFDVLSDGFIREGIKEYANWQTIPQLYNKKEFIGGCDIMMEMYQSGELKQALAA